MSSTQLNSGYLVLIPDMGSEIPTSRAASTNTTPASEISEPTLVERRRSSTSSMTGLRFLKLAPIYFGGEPDDCDYVEI